MFKIVTTLTINLIRFFTESGWITKILAIFILWLSPALELFLLLIALISIDYLLETYKIWRRPNKRTSIKHKLWANSKIFVTKLIFYSIMVLVLNALQVHLVKEVFEIYRWVIAIPIIGESFSILATIEKYTGMSLVKGVKSVFTSIFGKEGLSEEIVEDAVKNSKKKREYEEDNKDS